MRKQSCLHEELTRYVLDTMPKRMRATGEDCVYSWNLHDIAHALSILARLDEGTNAGVEARDGMLLVGGPNPDRMDPDEVSRLIRLDFHYNETLACWTRRI